MFVNFDLRTKIPRVKCLGCLTVIIFQCMWYFKTALKLCRICHKLRPSLQSQLIMCQYKYLDFFFFFWKFLEVCQRINQRNFVTGRNPNQTLFFFILLDLKIWKCKHQQSYKHTQFFLRPWFKSISCYENVVSKRFQVSLCH